MASYNICIPLIIRQANDVEENPGPTIFEVVDSTATVCADYNQGNEVLFGENAGKQCVAMSLTAIIYHHIEDINLWSSSTLNNILVTGNNLYSTIRSIVRTNDYLRLTDVPAFVSIFDNVYTLQYSESLTGSLFLTSNNGPFMTLQNAITELFFQQNYNCCLLTIGINAVAVFRISQHSFKIFDSHSRDLHGMPHSFGTCTLLSIEGLENLTSYLQLSCLQTCTVPFEIKGVLISDTQPDVEHVHAENCQQKCLFLSSQTNPEEPISLKRKNLTERCEVSVLYNANMRKRKG